jgi:uncharacterized protein
MYIIIAIVAFGASLLTLVAGFGLGTLLMPVFGLFFPIEVAIALTGIVHLLNNLFKLTLLGRSAQWPLVWRFGLPSVAGGLLGAWVLTNLTRLPVWHTWYWGARACQITPLKVIVAIVMVFFCLMELVPRLQKWRAGGSFPTIGGLLSGFFGGLSGHQGALRSAFLLQTGLDKTAFVATGVVIACMVDLTRIPMYMARMGTLDWREQGSLLLLATLSAFAGAWMGTRFLKKITLQSVQYITATFILLIACLLGVGIL